MVQNIISFIFSLLVLSYFYSCDSSKSQNFKLKKQTALTDYSLVVLGNVQDAGSPHIDCKKDCCSALFKNPDPSRKVVSLGIIDRASKKKFLIEATPDITTQLQHLNSYSNSKYGDLPDGVLLTHAHIGHYTGLMYFGREAKASQAVKVLAMPKMKSFLENNGPWSQLVKLKNIQLEQIEAQQRIWLTQNISIEAFKVPHRDEFSETVGFKIFGPQKSVLFIPDIDKWEKWDEAIIQWVKEVDYAFLDASFYDQKEIKHRDIAEIPHPFVIESMQKFKDLPLVEKNKIYFIHLNHTNPLLDEHSAESKKVQELGFKVARFDNIFPL